MSVDRHAWSHVLSEQALETDYDNFRLEVARHEGAGSPYEHALYDVWLVMHRLQKRDWLQLTGGRARSRRSESTHRFKPKAA